MKKLFNSFKKYQKSIESAVESLRNTSPLEGLSPFRRTVPLDLWKEIFPSKGHVPSEGLSPI
jgi:hypothetical protein